jgi:hypothetical protein
MALLNKINKMPSRICSIDASTNSLAFAFFFEGNLEKVGKINFSGKDTYQKLSDAARKTSSFFELYDNLDAIVIEHTIYLNSAKTVADLSLVQGAMLAGINLKKNHVIKSINPIAWQTFLGNQRLTKEEKETIRLETPGKSEAWYKNKEREFRKQRTIDIIFDLYAKKINDNDVADAVGVGHYAIHNWSKMI